MKRDTLPPGMPFNGAIKRGGESSLDRDWRRRDWISYLKGLSVSWSQIREISICYGTAIPPPWNHWWSDLPIQFVPELVDSIIESGSIEDSSLRIRDVVHGLSLIHISEPTRPY